MSIFLVKYPSFDISKNRGVEERWVLKEDGSYISESTGRAMTPQNKYFGSIEDPTQVYLDNEGGMYYKGEDAWIILNRLERKTVR